MKMYCSILFLVCVVSFSTVANDIYPVELVRFTEEANKTERWALGTTKRWDTFEQFFLKRDKKPYLRCGYLYDIKQEKILSKKNSLAIAPYLAEIIPSLSSDTLVSTNELEEFLTIELPNINQHRYVYIYFDVPVDENGDYQFSANPGFRDHLVQIKERREKAARILDEHQDIPKYRIEVPLIGFKPQKF